MLEQVVQQLWQASEDRKECRISLQGEPLPRVVHPYGVCTTSGNKIVLVCRQVTGFTKAGGKAGYRNLALNRIQEIEVLERKFHLSEDFNPKDEQYKDWVFHI